MDQSVRRADEGVGIARENEINRERGREGGRERWREREVRWRVRER